MSRGRTKKQTQDKQSTLTIKYNASNYNTKEKTMKIYSETYLRNFNFWSGAKDRVKYLSYNDLDVIENTLNEIYPDGMSETQINDIFWFEEDFIAECLGYENFEKLMEDKK